MVQQSKTAHFLLRPLALISPFLRLCGQFKEHPTLQLWYLVQRIPAAQQSTLPWCQLAMAFLKKYLNLGYFPSQGLPSLYPLIHLGPSGWRTEWTDLFCTSWTGWQSNYKNVAFLNPYETQIPPQTSSHTSLVEPAVWQVFQLGSNFWRLAFFLSFFQRSAQ